MTTMTPMRALCLLMAACIQPGSANAADSGGDQQGPHYKRTRFGQLTSEVWRYKRPFVAHDLTPVANNNPNPEPLPLRDRPGRAVLNGIGTKLYVTLQGTELDPGHEIVVIDTATEKVIKRIPVGSRPYQAVLHPDSRFLVVTNELSNYMTVIDTHSDEVAGQIPLDYYAQGLVFSRDGRRAWVAIRYLGQVLVLDIDHDGHGLTGKVKELGGFSEDAFFGRERPLPAGLLDELKDRGIDAAAITQAASSGVGGVNGILRSRCRNCHLAPAGGFQSGPDKTMNFLSAVENTIPGKPYQSPLLRAVIPASLGGFGDVRTTPEFHSGGVLFKDGDPDLKTVVDWIKSAVNGPGITVGNPGSHPKDLVLSHDERYLFVGNTGTMDISIIDTQANQEVGGLFLQNVANFVTIHHDQVSGTETLIALTMGAGFGAPKERDPYGGETWDRDNAAAQFTVLRDPDNGDAYPWQQQHAMGPFDAVDGTWNFKMRDIQNDLVAIDLSRLTIPAYDPDRKLDYLLMANRYEAHPEWVRYTSDTAEATTGDIKGDIPPELQRVPGAMPEWGVFDGDRLFVSMSGSFELVEWRVDANAADPAERLVPVKVYQTGLRPLGVAIGSNGPADGKLYAVNQLSEDITVIDRDSGASRRIAVGASARPVTLTSAEMGELVAHSTVFSSDGDISCLHCHYRDGGDGRAWGAAEVVGQNKAGHLTSGGTLGIPQMKNVYAIQPYYFEGTHLLSEGQGADINEPMSSIDFDRPIWAGDFTGFESDIPVEQRRLMHEELKERVEIRRLGAEWYDLEARRERFVAQQSENYFGKPYHLRDLYGFMGTWLGNETRLFPNPFDQEHPSVKRGRKLFFSANVMCGVCHTAPEFTNKGSELANNPRRALPPLVTTTRRDASYSLASVNFMERVNGDPLGLDRQGDPGRIETPEATFTTMHLRGLFDRPQVFLHHARTRSLREVILTPNHPAAREFRYPVYQGSEQVRPGRMEIGFNETTARTASGKLAANDTILDTHGGTSHLTPHQLEDLLHFLESIE
jgi:YVTN family beta-propeller protein